MMKMTGRVVCCGVALLFALTSVSAVQVLESISDLKNLDYGPSVPEHSLVLLYWFAHTVNINQNNEIWLTFDPENQYSSHRYHNHENVLDPLPPGRDYYTIGNLYEVTSVPLPPYVLHPPTFFTERNMDRIIIRVSGQRIDQVYLTQHYGSSHYRRTEYDPSRTYQITTDLLRQIRQFSMGADYQTLLILGNRFRGNADVSTISNTLRDLACLGLFLCIVMQRQISFKQQSRRPDNRNNESNENSSPVNNYETRVQINNDETRVQINNDETRVPVNGFTREPQNNNWCLLYCCVISLFFVFIIIRFGI